jgi:hypothetical protein
VKKQLKKYWGIITTMLEIMQNKLLKKNELMIIIGIEENDGE